MKCFLFFLILFPSISHASFIFQYGLNYSAESDSTANDDYEKSRMFHKVYLGASVNGRKTLFLGWNTNSWTSSLNKNSVDDKYSMTEMGPRLVWFFNDNYNGYLSAEWNPYAVGTREKSGVSSDVTGSSMAFAVGYRFKLSRLWGFGAGLHYHALSLKEEKIGSTEENISASIKNIMPMLELTLITK